MPSNNHKDMRRLRVAAVQLESLPADKEANFQKIEAFTKKAAAEGARLVCFPECCITGYWFIRKLTLAQLAALAEPIPAGPSTRRLSGLAREHKVTIGAGLVEAAGDDTFYNSYVVALPDGAVDPGARPAPAAGRPAAQPVVSAIATGPGDRTVRRLS